MKFFLGTHHATQTWFDLDVPLFASRRVLTTKKKLPEPKHGWALDSGGFTELDLYGGWKTTLSEYVADVLRFEREMGHLEWASPMDWMCEPHMLEKTGLSIIDHQERTVENFLRLRERLGRLVIPVLQGWELNDYKVCWERYERAGVDLRDERIVGVGTICRRQNTAIAGRIFFHLHGEGLKMHGFGVKITGFKSFSSALVSADSMAWSIDARWHAAHGRPPLPGCTHKSCANCPRYAMRWRQKVLNQLDQLQLEV